MIRSYLATVETRLAQAGFEPVEPPVMVGLDRCMRRSRLELVQVGTVMATCGVKVLTGLATVADVRDFGRAFFDAATSPEALPGRTPFQQVVAYPVLVATAVEPGVGAFLESHWPKRWMTFEFPVVVSLGSGEVLMHRSTPLWGAIFHAGLRAQAEVLFRP
jgi:hypothetical protein